MICFVEAMEVPSNYQMAKWSNGQRKREKAERKEKRAKRNGKARTNEATLNDRSPSFGHLAI
jgi:hypothetical protein